MAPSERMSETEVTLKVQLAQKLFPLVAAIVKIADSGSQKPTPHLATVAVCTQFVDVPDRQPQMEWNGCQRKAVGTPAAAAVTIFEK